MKNEKLQREYLCWISIQRAETVLLIPWDDSRSFVFITLEPSRSSFNSEITFWIFRNFPSPTWQIISAIRISFHVVKTKVGQTF